MSLFAVDSKSLKSIVLAAGMLGASHLAASAYCGVVEESAIGPNAQIATFLAAQKARNAVRQAAGPQVANSADYNNSACVLADQAGTRARCSVQASFCVNPVVATPPVMPRPPVLKRSCVTFRAKATGTSHAQAQELVIHALGETMAQRGGTLGSPGVTSDAPACYFLDDGTNKVRCEMMVRDCR